MNPGDPCPVCGSREHPRKAVAMEHVPSQEELDQLQEHLELARTEMENASKKAAELVGKVDLQKKQIMEKLHELEKEKMLAEPMESENWKVQDIQSQIHNKQVELAEQENKLTEQILDNTKRSNIIKIFKANSEYRKKIVEKQAERRI